LLTTEEARNVLKDLASKLQAPVRKNLASSSSGARRKKIFAFNRDVQQEKMS